jgi:hypothetical protein
MRSRASAISRDDSSPRAILTSCYELLRVGFLDSDSFFENEMESKLEQSRSLAARAMPNENLRESR